MIKYFKRCWEFLDEMKDAGRVSMIHCKSGNSRGAVVAMGYLMHHLELTFKEAYWLVKKSRPAINPQEGFLEQLVHYEYFLSQQHQISLAHKQRESEQAALDKELQRQMDLDMGILDEEEEEKGKGKEKETEKEDAEDKEEETEEDKEWEAKRKLFLTQVNRVRARVPSLVDLILKQTHTQLASHVTHRIQNGLWDGMYPPSSSSFLTFSLHAPFSIFPPNISTCTDRVIEHMRTVE